MKRSINIHEAAVKVYKPSVPKILQMNYTEFIQHF